MNTQPYIYIYIRNSKNGLQPCQLNVVQSAVHSPRSLSPILDRGSKVRCHCRGLLQMRDARVQRQNGNLSEIYDEKMNTVAFLNILIIHRRSARPSEYIFSGEQRPRFSGVTDVVDGAPA